MMNNTLLIASFLSSPYTVRLMSRKLVLFLLCVLPLWLFAADYPLSQVYANPETVLDSFRIAYPGIVTEVKYDQDRQDWFMVVRGIPLYWSEGRILPDNLRTSYEKWRPIVDYVYPRELPDPSQFKLGLISVIRAEAELISSDAAPLYNDTFFNIVYDGSTRREVEEHITRFDYLGTRVSVHEDLVGAMKRIEKRILNLAKTDEQIRVFLSSISSIEGYNWREVRESTLRSKHSWGIAVDILPKNWGQKNIYWNWISYWNDNWMLIPLTRRWIPPEKVISIFEEEGFIWGGKWHLWDNMHFEYRPEMLVLSNRPYSGEER